MAKWTSKQQLSLNQGLRWKGRDLQMACNMISGDGFRMARQCVRENWDITGEKCIQNNEDLLAIDLEDKNETYKSYYEGLLNMENARHGIGVLHDDPTEIPKIWVESNAVEEMIRGHEEKKLEGSSRKVTEMLKMSGEVEYIITTQMFNPSYTGRCHTQRLA